MSIENNELAPSKEEPTKNQDIQRFHARNKRWIRQTIGKYGTIALLLACTVAVVSLVDKVKSSSGEPLHLPVPSPSPGAMSVIGLGNSTRNIVRVTGVFTNEHLFSAGIVEDIPPCSEINIHVRDIAAIPTPFLGAATFSSDAQFNTRINYEYPAPTATRTIKEKIDRVDRDGNHIVELNEVQRRAGRVGLDLCSPNYVEDAEDGDLKIGKIKLTDAQKAAVLYGMSYTTTLASGSSNYSARLWDSSALDVSFLQNGNPVKKGDVFTRTVLTKGISDLGSEQIKFFYNPDEFSLVELKSNSDVIKTKRTFSNIGFTVHDILAASDPEMRGDIKVGDRVVTSGYYSTGPSPRGVDGEVKTFDIILQPNPNFIGQTRFGAYVSYSKVLGEIIGDGGVVETINITDDSTPVPEATPRPNQTPVATITPGPFRNYVPVVGNETP